MSDRDPGDKLWEAITGGNANAQAATSAAGAAWDRPTRLSHRHSRRRRLGTVLVALLLLGAMTGSSAHGHCRAGIPAYFYPGTGDPHWPQVSQMSSSTLLVANPANGPGEAIDPNYATVLEQVRLSDQALYGYVDTAYGTRPTDIVQQEAQTWLAWYGVEGIFLDQTSSGAADVAYYQELNDWLHAQDLDVAMNPGQPDIDRRYLSMSEHIVTFEGPYEQYLSQPFKRSRRATNDRTWHLVYAVGDARKMREVVALARRRGAGMIFVTDGLMPNPWDRLPSYWRQEQKLLARC